MIRVAMPPIRTWSRTSTSSSDGAALGPDRLGEQLHRVAVAGGDLAARRQRLDQVEAGDGEVAGEDVEQGREARPAPARAKAPSGVAGGSIAPRTCASIIS